MSRRQFIRHGEAVVLIAVGGCLGATARYLLGGVAGGALVTTLLVNVAGSFVLGLLLFDIRADEFVSKRLRYVFGAGFCASFTTYSTFIADIVLSAPQVAVLYLVASYACGFGAILASRVVVTRISTDPVGPPVTEGD